MGALEEVRERNRRRDDPFDQGAARDEYGRFAKRRGRESEKASRDAYSEGRREERTRQRERSQRRPASRRRAPASFRKAARQLEAPVKASMTSWARLAMLAVLVAGLYQFLEGANAVSGFLGGVARGFEWLRRPDRSIPYAPGQKEPA